MFNDWLMRRMMSSGASEPEPLPPYPLKYCWDGSDSLVGGKWVDQVNGKEWTAINSPTHDGSCYAIDNNTNNFFMNLNTQGIMLGELWEVAIDFVPVSYGGHELAAFDFGSVNSSNRAFAVLVMPNQYITDNFKEWGNDTRFQARLYASLALGTRHTVRVGCEEYDENNDIQYIQLDRGAKVYASTPHVKFSIDATFNKSDGYIGRGNLQSYSAGSMKIYSLKIYAN